MKSFRTDPYLWLHLAGIAAFPLFLQITWLGLSIGDPITPYWLELGFLVVVGLFPIFWMQWYRPFDIYSLLIVALKADRLTPDQLKILALFKQKKQRLLSLIGALLMIWLLWKIYQLAPLATLAAHFLPSWRWLGLLIATLGLLASHLFLQVPLAVLGVLFSSQQAWEAISPLPATHIAQAFTVLGLRVNQILPPLDGTKTIPNSDGN